MADEGLVFEWVEFDLPAGATRDDALALYRASAAVWATNPDLVRKTYVFDEARGIGGGLYVWRTREAAARWHGEDYRAMIRTRYGSEPRISVTDALLDVVPEHGVTSSRRPPSRQPPHEARATAAARSDRSTWP